MLRHALRADLRDVAEIWTDAFSGDPFFRWMQPDDNAWPAFGNDWFGFIADLTFERGHTYLHDQGAAAIAWIPPDLVFIGPEDLERGLGIITRHAGSARADAARETIFAARGQIPDAPHWTLQFIGVRRSGQGAGIGAQIVAPILAVCDREQMPCWLVSSNPANLSFYRRIGFEVEGEAWSPDGAVCLRPMSRAAAL